MICHLKFKDKTSLKYLFFNFCFNFTGLLFGVILSWHKYLCRSKGVLIQTVYFLVINFSICNFRNKAFMMLTRWRTVQVPGYLCYHRCKWSFNRCICQYMSTCSTAFCTPGTLENWKTKHANDVTETWRKVTGTYINTGQSVMYQTVRYTKQMWQHAEKVLIRTGGNKVMNLQTQFSAELVADKKNQLMH